MQTKLTEQFLNTAEGKKADEILRSCVHCGFCTATCPTYQLLGDELDGPRGRIYQIKQVLEGHAATARTQQHLDQCLMCRACETTCPSGVQYAQLLEIGRHQVQQQVRRSWQDRTLRQILNWLIPYPKRFSFFYRLGLMFKPLLPTAIKKQLIAIQADYSDQNNLYSHNHKVAQHGEQAKTILVLEGCVQSVVTPETNEMAASVFSRLGYQLKSIQKAGCCGAVSEHLLKADDAKQLMKQNIDAWWPHVEQGVEGILANASGCGVMLKDYGQKFADSPEYAEKARVIANLVKDPIEILVNEDLSALNLQASGRKVAFHAPCTLQHGLHQQGIVESLLTRLGFDLVEIRDSHLCCGSAGTYSVFQPALSKQLLANKVEAISKDDPDIIVTANIGCQMHLQSSLQKPVKHWLSLLIEST